MSSNPGAQAFLQAYMQRQAAGQQQKLAVQQFAWQNMWNQAKLAQEQQLEQQRIDNENKYRQSLIADTQASQALATGKTQLEALDKGNVVAQPMTAPAPLNLPPSPTDAAAATPAALPVATSNPMQRTGLQLPPEGAVNLGGMLLRPKTGQETLAEQQALAQQQHQATIADIDARVKSGEYTKEVGQTLKTLHGAASLLGAYQPNEAVAAALGFAKPTAPREGDEPLTDDQIEQNNALARQLGDINKVDTSAAMLKKGATRHDLANANARLTTISGAVGAKAQRDQVNATRQAELQARLNQEDARRSDLSYRSSVAEVDKIAKPITDLAPRLARLEDTLSQKNMQADALVAPELLSIIAGGPGSGIRMNEAEIARIVGGRTAYETLKAFGSKVAGDPSTARSIMPEQDRQIHALVDAVKQRYAPVQQAIDDAHETIANSTDPSVHKQAVLKVHKALSTLSSATTDSIPTPTTQAEFNALPHGAHFKKPNDPTVYVKQ